MTEKIHPNFLMEIDAITTFFLEYKALELKQDPLAADQYIAALDTLATLNVYFTTYVDTGENTPSTKTVELYQKLLASLWRLINTMLDALLVITKDTHSDTKTMVEKYPEMDSTEVEHINALLRQDPFDFTTLLDLYTYTKQCNTKTRVAIAVQIANTHRINS